MLEKLPDAVGHALSGVRAGLDQTLYHAVDLRQGMAAITVASLAFADHAPMPQKYSADGAGLSPPLHWSGVPAAATAVALIVEDADSPTPAPLVHAIVVDLPAGDGALAEGVMSELGEVPPVVPMGRNSYLQAAWLPPDPLPGHGAHRYVFQIFALAPGPAFEGMPGRDALRAVLVERGLASGCLIGTYERPDATIAESVSATEVGLPRLAAG